MASKISIAIPADLQQVRFAAAALQGVLRALDCGEDQAPMIELAVVEAINNAIEHAYAETPDGRVELQLEGAHGALQISVTDRGRAMPAEALERARAGGYEPAAPPREGGYGLGIILEVMSNVGYRTEHDLNTLTMSITLNRSPA
jgi:serine/threonine-protein kinase RsbW